jgi:hypothetical protein
LSCLSTAHEATLSEQTNNQAVVLSTCAKDDTELADLQVKLLHVVFSDVFKDASTHDAAKEVMHQIMQHRESFPQPELNLTIDTVSKLIATPVSAATHPYEKWLALRMVTKSPSPLLRHWLSLPLPKVPQLISDIPRPPHLSSSRHRVPTVLACFGAGVFRRRWFCSVWPPPPLGVLQLARLLACSSTYCAGAWRTHESTLGGHRRGRCLHRCKQKGYNRRGQGECLVSRSDKPSLRSHPIRQRPCQVDQPFLGLADLTCDRSCGCQR